MTKGKKQLTIKDLLAQKEKLKTDRKKGRQQKLYVESLDAQIVIQEPSRAIALEAMEMLTEHSKTELSELHLVYHCVVEPNLKSEELQAGFGCVEPTDIVSELFRSGEISMIAGEAMRLAGYVKGIEKVDKEIKN